ncbi:hypothetical protein GCWU000341_02663 [Oribacterium sp. oral taxon 078 str. F0262]|nr:hypothetical protein GCWU000341_02663 [Oribacterium sp. oral taxon 078 str. F0262]
MPPFLPPCRSNAGRSRSGCRVQRRVSDLKNQIAKRRGGRRPAYGPAKRQGDKVRTAVGEAEASKERSVSRREIG